MNILGAFSSDYRDLYKGDVYRALSLPHGYIHHFRYDRNRVEESIYRSPSSLEGKELAVIFSFGSKDDSENPVKGDIAIRKGVVTHAHVSEQTNILHIYFRLRGFCDFHFDEKKRDPTKFLTEIETLGDTFKSVSWRDRVEAVAPYFPPLIFYLVQGFRKKNNLYAELKYTDLNRACYYELEHGADYTLDLLLGNPRSVDSKVKISESSKEVHLNSINPLTTTARYDDLHLQMHINSMPLTKQNSIARFQVFTGNGQSEVEQAEYALNVGLQMRMGWLRPAQFAFFSSIVYWIFVETGSERFEPGWVVVVGLFIALGCMHYFFNKK